MSIHIKFCSLLEDRHSCRASYMECFIGLRAGPSRLFTNRSNQPGDDMKDEVRTDDDWHAWKIWRTPGTVYGDYGSLVPHCSFLVRKESLQASMTRSERKSMLYRYSFSEVSKMCQLAERKRGSIVEDANPYIGP